MLSSVSNMSVHYRDMYLSVNKILLLSLVYLASVICVQAYHVQLCQYVDYTFSSKVN